VIKQHVEDQVIEMMNGCVCCTVRGDLVKVIRKLLSEKKRKFDGIIIETTGMADPAPVAQTFFVDEEIAEKCVLDGIITVVDAKHIIQHLDEVKPEGAENESIEQIAFADRVLLNKTDLVDEATIAEVRRRVKSINVAADIIECQYGKVDPKLLIGIGGFNIKRVMEMEPDFLEDGEHDHVHDQSVSSISFKLNADLNLGMLNHWIGLLIQTFSNELYRYKGVISVKGMEERFVFQGVHMLFDGEFCQPWGDEPRESKFVFIGKNLDKEAIESGFLRCKAPETLRFKVSDKVLARVTGGFKAGKVIGLWNEGRPYRIRLEDGTEVWGPDDSDLFVKAAV